MPENPVSTNHRPFLPSMSTLKKSLALLAGASLVLIGFTSCESGSNKNVKSGFGRNTTTSQIMGQHRKLSR
jgi:hypothetical protein